MHKIYTDAPNLLSELLGTLEKCVSIAESPTTSDFFERIDGVSRFIYGLVFAVKLSIQIIYFSGKICKKRQLN
jgi:hypothetical protein